MSVQHEDQRAKEKRAWVDRRPAPTQDHSNNMVGLAIATIVTLGIMIGGFWALVGYQGLLGEEEQIAPSAQPSPGPEAAPAPEASEAPAPTPTAVVTPPAPTSNQLRSRDLLLSPYAIVSTDGELTVTGTVTNLSNSTANARIRVFVYVQGTVAGVGEGEVLQLSPDTGTEINLPTGSPWIPGSKVLLLQAEPIEVQ